MIRLCDRISIRTTPEHLFHWLEALPQEYVRWHPDHISCRMIKGSRLQAGSEVECKEYLHGKMHAIRLRLTRIISGRRLEYQVVGMGEGAFEVVPEDGEVLFIAELGLGSSAPVIAPMVDFLLRFWFSTRLDAMKEHMREEGQNLKNILEADWQKEV